MFVCIRCQGIKREVCTSSGGEQFCSCCKKEGEQANPNLQMDSMVLTFKCSCPLIARGCGWVEALGGCQNHLDTCGYVYETCKLRCGEVLQRDELKVHEKENCPQRIVECKHCREEFKFCELPTHLEMCPKMEVSCELKCGKILCSENMAQHLEQECGLVVEICKLRCGVELTRDELKIHVTDTCVQRKIPCEHCGKDFKSCDMASHLGVCHKMEVSCELECGVIMCREDMTRHLEVYCPEKELECPFAKYKCVGLIKRKDMSKHLEEKRIEHLELKLFEQEATIVTMSQEIKSLRKTVLHLTHIPVKLEWRITKLPDNKNDIKKRFLLAGYHFEFNFCKVSFESFAIQICPLNGWYYEKRKWPFKAEFITHLNSRRDPNYNMEFKSEVILFKSDTTDKSSILAKITKDDFMRYHYTNGEAEFEIYVIL